MDLQLRFGSHLLFVLWLQEEYQVDNNLQIFQEEDLFGVKNQVGEIIIPPQYKEIQPFSCGLALVRNSQYQYAYINIINKQVIIKKAVMIGCGFVGSASIGEEALKLKKSAAALKKLQKQLDFKF